MDPLFILSSPRSFTSVVAGMIGMHPCLYPAPELHLMERDSVEELMSFFIAERQEKKLHGLRRVLSQLILGEQTLAGVRLADRWIERRINFSTSAVYRELISMSGGLGFVDKSPAYSLSPATLERLSSEFPRSHFIHLVRHPVGQGLSMAKLLPSTVAARRKFHAMQAVYRADSAIVPPLARDLLSISSSQSEKISARTLDVDFQYLWLRMQLRIEDFLLKLDKSRVYFLRGEDFLQDPLHHVRLLCEWLDLPWSEDCEELVLHPELSPYASIGPQGAQFGNDINYLRSPSYVKRDVQVPLFGDMRIPWRSNEVAFSRQVVDLAHKYGYS